MFLCPDGIKPPFQLHEQIDFGLQDAAFVLAGSRMCSSQPANCITKLRFATYLPSTDKNESHRHRRPRLYQPRDRYFSLLAPIPQTSHEASDPNNPSPRSRPDVRVLVPGQRDCHWPAPGNAWLSRIDSTGVARGCDGCPQRLLLPTAIHHAGSWPIDPPILRLPTGRTGTDAIRRWPADAERSACYQRPGND